MQRSLSCISRKRIFTAAPFPPLREQQTFLSTGCHTFHRQGPRTQSAMKVKLQWQMPMNCSSFLRGATVRRFFTLGRRRKKFPRLAHFRFSPMSPIVSCLNAVKGLKYGPCGRQAVSSTHSVGGGCFWGTQRERLQNEQESSSPRARYLGQLNQALATY